MALRNIVQTGDPILQKKCRTVTEFNDRLGQLLTDMTETLVDAEGLGLAGPQVGILRRVCIVAREKEDGTLEYFELVNPVITQREGEDEKYEGCLSIPGRIGWIKRPQKIRFTAQTRTGEVFTMEAEDMFARAVCHELDHLDGRTLLESAAYMEDIVDDEPDDNEAIQEA